MIRQQTSTTQPNIMLLSFLSLLLALTIGLTDMRPALATEGSSRTTLSQPGSPVELAIDLTGFTIDRDRIKQDGRRYMMASHPATGIHVSIALEKVSGPASTTGCVQQLRQLQKGPAVSRAEDIALSTSHDVQTLEYTLPRFQGVRLDQKSIYACIAEQHVYATVHLSKVQYSAADASLFQSFLKTIRMQPSQPLAMTTATPATSTSQESFQIESVRYRYGDPAQAIAP